MVRRDGGELAAPWWAATAIAALGALAALSTGCDDAATVTCGSGGEIVDASDGRVYCIYRTTRDCPDRFPFPLDVGSTLVCSEVAATPAQLPPEVCARIGASACVAPNDAGADGAPGDAGLDASSRDGGLDASSRDARADVERPDAGACAPVPWDRAVIVSTGEVLGDHVALATSEAAGRGYLHVGLIEDGRALVTTRAIASPTAEIGRADLSTDWRLLEVRSIGLARDADSGRVFATTLQGSTGLDVNERATIGAIEPGASSVMREGRIIADPTDRLLGRPVMLGGADGVERRFVWRVVRGGAETLGSVGASYSPESYREIAAGAPGGELVELRGARRIVLLPATDGLRLWDAFEGAETTPIDSVVTPEGSAALLDTGPDEGSGRTFLVAYPGPLAVYLHPIVCSPECVGAGPVQNLDIGLPSLDHTTLDVVPGGYLIGLTSDGGAPLFARARPSDLSVIPDGPSLPPAPAGSAGSTLDVQTAVVHDADQTNVVIAVLTGPAGSAQGDQVYVTGLRLGAGCE